jgi:hypothetical protein
MLSKVCPIKGLTSNRVFLGFREAWFLAASPIRLERQRKKREEERRGEQEERANLSVAPKTIDRRSIFIDTD